jgi:UDP-N-acetylglucosamine 2-epimerase
VSTRIATIVGARPQFIKAAPVSAALAAAGCEELLIHTGQHYDVSMSDVFFSELPIPKPAVNLEVGSSSPARQTAEVMLRVEGVLEAEKPDWVLVYGDTNSTLGGALAANKAGIALAHVEAGLRSYNRAMPEEHNRVLTDHVSDLLFCPTQTAVDNLARESIVRGVHRVGDTMYDAVLQFGELAARESSILQDLDLEPGRYLLTTVHRNYNTDDPQALVRLLSTLSGLDEVVVFPVHPRTRKEIERLGAQRPDLSSGSLRLVDPVSYLDMLALEKSARMVLTDSGGMQKEAYFLGVPCATLRSETEWVETVDAGWNRLVGSDPDLIRRAVSDWQPPTRRPDDLFGAGDAAPKIAARLAQPLASESESPGS